MASTTKLNPPGQWVDVGGYRLHAQVVGQGSPTIVMDTGLGFPGLYWEAVLREVAPFARVVCVDRAGFGWSNSAPPDMPRTSANIVTETRALLAGLGQRPPYLLAGHSFGGLNMILFAQTHPAEVAGLVLIDSSHPEQIARLPGMMSAKALQDNMKLMIPLARWGVLRWFNYGLLRSTFAGQELLSPEARAAFEAFASAPENYANALREAEALETSVTQMRVAPGVLGALPLTVLTAGYWATGGFMAGVKQKWLAMQREHAAMSSRGTHAIVPNCNHASIVTLGRAAVIAAFRQMVETSNRV